MMIGYGYRSQAGMLDEKDTALLVYITVFE